jgi:hypothetical protein
MQFDPLVIVIDWLDACRNADGEFLLGLYDSSATLHCDCTGTTYRGRTEIKSYWSDKLFAQAPSAFEIDELYHEGDAVSLSCKSFEGKPIRIQFWFTDTGTIAHSLCGPRACATAAH